MYYISFATDDGFLGATVVEASSSESALEEATRLGINPGGEAAILEVPEGFENEARQMLNRLVGLDEMLTQHGGKRHGDLSDEHRGRVENAADVVREGSNSERSIR